MVQISTAQVSSAGVIPKAFASGLTIGTSGFVFSSGGAFTLSGTSASGLITSSNVAKWRIQVLHHISGGANLIVKGMGVAGTYGSLNASTVIGSGQINGFDLMVRSGITYDFGVSSSGVIDYLSVDEYQQG